MKAATSLEFRIWQNKNGTEQSGQARWTLPGKGRVVVWVAHGASHSEMVPSSSSWILRAVSTWHPSLSLCPKGHPVLSAKALSV